MRNPWVLVLVIVNAVDCSVTASKRATAAAGEAVFGVGCGAEGTGMADDGTVPAAGPLVVAGGGALGGSRSPRSHQ